MRHPVYIGILLAVLGTVAAKGTVLGLVGALIITFGLWPKALLEERWHGQELEPEANDNYRRRVPMLLPFGPRETSFSVRQCGYERRQNAGTAV